MRSSSQCPRGHRLGRHLFGAGRGSSGTTIRTSRTTCARRRFAPATDLTSLRDPWASGVLGSLSCREARPRQATRSRAEGFSSEDGPPSATPATTSPRQCFARRTSSAGVSSSSGVDLGRRGWSGSRRRTTPASARHAIFGMRTHGSCGGDCTVCGHALSPSRRRRSRSSGSRQSSRIKARAARRRSLRMSMCSTADTVGVAHDGAPRAAACAITGNRPSAPAATPRARRRGDRRPTRRCRGRSRPAEAGVPPTRRPAPRSDTPRRDAATTRAGCPTEARPHA